MKLPHAEWTISSATPEELLQAAITARGNAYAPYSGFPVGAALLAEGGRVFTGGNIENGSYGLTVCAERSALSVMIAAGFRGPEAVAVAGRHGEPCQPCGACRQVLSEFNPGMLVVLESVSGSPEIFSLGVLFPMPFDLGGR